MPLMSTNNCNHNIRKQKQKKNVRYHQMSCKCNCYLLTRMSALQNTVCQKVRNSFSYKIRQPKKRYKKFSCYRSMQTFYIT